MYIKSQLANWKKERQLKKEKCRSLDFAANCSIKVIFNEFIALPLLNF